MGYCMSMREADFCILQNKADVALKAIKALAGKETYGTHFSWVTTSEFMNADTLQKAMQAWRWDLSSYEDDGDLKEICFNGEKLGDDKILLDAIAPFVEKGSYIEMHGEDGALWRWVFDGKTCKEVYGTVSWGE